MVRGQRLISVDSKTRIIIRSRKAVALSPVEFTVFMKLYKERMPVLTRSLINSIYDGVKDPPLYPHNVLTAIIRQLQRKLAHLKLAIETENHRSRTTRRLVRC